MYNLDKAYNKKFFARRKSLDWRAPIIVNAIMRVFNPSSLIDFGCARGEYVQGFINCGVNAYGLEGSNECLDSIVIDRSRMIVSDLRLPIIFDQKYDLCLCLEVVEHIEEEYINQLMKNFKNASSKVLISAAPPGQGGHYHVNCKSKIWWWNRFSSFGYERNQKREEQLKKYFTHINRKEVACYYNNLMYFQIKV